MPPETSLVSLTPAERTRLEFACERIIRLAKAACGCRGSAIVVPLSDQIWRVGDEIAPGLLMDHPVALRSGQGIATLSLEAPTAPENAADIVASVSAEIEHVLEARRINEIARGEERLRTAVEDAGLHVYEVDFIARALHKAGAEDTFFETPKTFGDLAKNAWTSVHEDDRAAAERAWEECQRTGAQFRREYRMHRTDQRDVWALSTVRLVKDAAGRPVRLIGALQNITDRKHSDAEAKAARAMAEANAQRLAFALDAAKAAAWEIDMSGPTLVGGDQLAQVFGRPVGIDEILAMGDGALHADDRGAFKLFLSSLTAGVRADVEHRLTLADGSVRWVRTSGRAAEKSGAEADRYIFLTTDITARRELEAGFADAMRQAAVTLDSKRLLLDAIARDVGLEIEDYRPAPADRAGETTGFAALHARLAALLAEIDSRDASLIDAVEALRTARSAAQAGSQAKTQFLNTMTHELRTPLNAIIGFSEMLQEDLAGHEPPTCAEDAGRIHAAARRLLAIIDDVLSLSELDSGRLTLSTKAVDLQLLLDQLQPTFQRMAQENRNTLTVIAEPSLGAVCIDRARVSQCVLNLVSNACKFTQGGRVDVRARRERDLLEISISDTGCGIAPSQAQNLLQPFAQGDGSLTRAHDGAGLGLVITRKLAELMGGDLSFTSTPGEGSVFTVRTPVFATRARAAETAAFA